ncbi:MAG: hypothetical protein IPL61_06685, partial [Myxococcales bacterium]|nr:hypothetical protein [Myxococcales bacterium]
MLASWFDTRRRGEMMGVWSTCYQAGGVAAKLVAIQFLVRFGWRWTFFGPALCGSRWSAARCSSLLVRDRPSDVGFADFELPPMAGATRTVRSWRCCGARPGPRCCARPGSGSWAPTTCLKPSACDTRSCTGCRSTWPGPPLLEREGRVRVDRVRRRRHPVRDPARHRRGPRAGPAPDPDRGAVVRGAVRRVRA